MNLKSRKGTVSTGSFPASRLRVDPEVQRACGFSKHHVDIIARDWNPLAAGRLAVSKRSDGTLVVIDGMHRREAAPPDHVFRCDVYEGLTFEDECALFRLLNNTKRISAYDDFDKGVKSGDEECLAIKAVVEGNGLKISNQNTDGHVAAVAALRWVYRNGGEHALSRALSISVNAWGPVSPACDGAVIRGLGELAIRFNGEIDDAALINKLARSTEPSTLIGQAKSLRKMRGSGTVSDQVAEIVIGVYNKGRKRKIGAQG